MKLRDFIFKHFFNISVVIFLFIWFIILFKEISFLENVSKNKILNVVKTLKITLVDSILKTDLNAIDNIIDDLEQKISGLKEISIYDNRGICISSTNRKKIGKFNSILKSINSTFFKKNANNTFTLIDLITVENQKENFKKTIGYIYVYYFDKDYTKKLLDLYLRFALELLLILWITSIISKKVSQAITEKFLKLLNNLQKVVSSEFKTKVFVPKNEIKEIRYFALLIEKLRRKTNRFIDKLKKKLQQFSALLEVSEEIMSENFDLNKLLWEILLQVSVITEAKKVSIILKNEKGEKIVKAAKGFKEGFIENLKIQNTPILDLVEETKQAVIGIINKKETIFNTQKGNFIVVPLIINHTVIGFINISDKVTNTFFDLEDVTLLKMFANYAAIAINNTKMHSEILKKEVLSRDLEVAAQIQYSMLPKSAIDTDKVKIKGMVKFARLVGGDFYDYYMIDSNTYLITIADVSGKGIPAALITTLIKGIIKSVINISTNIDLKNIIKAVNSIILYDTSLKQNFVTMFIGLVKFENNKITLNYVNGGHNPPLLITKDNKVIELMPTGMLVGMFDTTWEEKIVQLNKGDKLILFTDGVTEALNEKGEMFSDERFRQFSLTSSLEEVFEEILNWIGTTEQFDDITLVEVKIKDEK